MVKRITYSLDLEPIRKLAREGVDQEAEEVRARFITLGAGQALVYEQKLREANLILSDPNVNPALVPNLSVEAQDLGVTLTEAAQVVMDAATQWSNISAQIESLRLGAKRQITNATSEAEINSATQIDWSAFQP